RQAGGDPLGADRTRADDFHVIRRIARALACCAMLASCKDHRGTSTSSAPSSSSTAAPTSTAAEVVPSPPGDRFSEAGMLEEARLYLESAPFRRRVLEESLVNHENTYSKHRLGNYGLVTRGWDRLPEWNPVSVPVDQAMANELRAGRELSLDAKTT